MDENEALARVSRHERKTRMRKIFASFLFLAAIFGPLTWNAAAAEPKPGATIFVALQGDDTWSGMLAAPNAAKTDGPLATLGQAQEKIRTLKKSGPLPAGGITVVVRGGTYFLPKTLEFSPADSGTAAAPIVYRAAEGVREKPLVSKN
jgi:hypothetical protein